ncbi:unnamed protein product [Rotaria sordida]|uniref:Uncharacterized protein n=1 Tax=Rotaria sordida TaxID=392033 RepID=A0A814ZU83_9BILA|nr:unnamed protein product [Rotaria sordida]
MMIKIQSLSIASCFNCLPNELILIIWTYLGHVESIRIFGTMKCQRYTRLLEKYCYKSINFREASLSSFQLFCSHLFNKIRLNVETLKIGHRFSYSQLRIFTQMRSGFVTLLEMFPKLQQLVLYNVPEMNSDDLEPYLVVIPYLQHVTLKKCSLKKVSSLICSNLLAHGTISQLQRCILHSDHRKNGIIFHEPISFFYQLQNSLIYLRIYIEDFISLKNLLQFLPKLLTLDVRICKNVTRNDNDLFLSCICPCTNLTKLIFRVHSVVQYFPSVVNFILLFRKSLVNLDLAFIHKDPAYCHSLVYVDGNLLFNELIIHITKLKKFNFSIETACLCNQQMDYFIKSFQTNYWLSMLIGLYYDKLNCIYVIFSLPYGFSDYFVTTTGIMYTQFNQTGYQLNDLVPMLFAKPYQVSVKIGQNETLSSSFVALLKQGTYRGEELINTTMTWLNWMPHLRLLRIDSQMLLKLVQTINLSDKIDQFSSLEKLVVDQLNNTPDDDDDTLNTIVRLGVSLSLQAIYLQEYKMLHFQSIDDNNFLLTICQICCNMHKLETMTIKFASPNSLSNSTMVEKLAGTEKKNCQFECIYVSDSFIQFWLDK